MTSSSSSSRPIPPSVPNNANEGRSRSTRQRTGLVPMDLSHVSNRSMNKTKEITIGKLMQPKINVTLKNHVNCMLIRMIGNKNTTKNDYAVRLYHRQQGNQKVT